jgi:hypothetical protein
MTTWEIVFLCVVAAIITPCIYYMGYLHARIQHNSNIIEETGKVLEELDKAKGFSEQAMASHKAAREVIKLYLDKITQLEQEQTQ